MLAWLKTAFALVLRQTAAPTETQRRLVERLAVAIVRRRLEGPALIALECSRPLNFVASQFLLFISPLAELVFPREEYREVMGYLERRESVELLCRRIEEAAAEAKVEGRGMKDEG